MHQLSITADDLVTALLRLSQDRSVCILDSSGVGHLGSHLMIAGIEPVEVLEVGSDDPSETLKLLDKKLGGDRAAIFTISYEFGQKIAGLKSRRKESADPSEPDVYLALFENLIVHDYTSGETKLVGDRDTFEHLASELTKPSGLAAIEFGATAKVSSNFTKAEYLAAIETIKEHIRDGDTYQTNLTQQLTAELPDGLTPEIVFERLRRDHPAPFAAFIKRDEAAVVSASPERFFRVSRHIARRNSTETAARRIETSPIKGTRHRGRTPPEDECLRADLLTSAKDRAENTMIVDLLRNDLGRVCEFGTVKVEELCDIEEHPTLFHLVSTISGDLRVGAQFCDILRAVFPCGSITGAPKISTMKIIDEIEPTNRGLSMGALGYYVPECWNTDLAIYDLSVAIRTMVIRGNIATFNVGGGITIDSDPAAEYDETLLKSKALLRALTQ